jgi:hypothetical protein
MLTEKDHQQIRDHGLEIEQVSEQIKNFEQGFPPARLKKPAIEGDGIIKLSESELQMMIKKYESESESKKIVKFVPASGAATRMFKNLFAFESSYDGSEEAYQKMIADQGSGTPYEFFKHLEKFAFYNDLKTSFKSSGKALEEAHLMREYKKILECFLFEKGLGFGELPKGLLKFHNYGNEARTQVEEHMVEGCQYALGAGRKVNIHFTVSPEHQAKFEEHISEVKSKYEKEFDGGVEENKARHE